MEVLILLSSCFYLSETHSLQYFYTEVTGINFPEFTAVGQVDGGQFVYYDSNIKKMIPKTEWIQKNDAVDPDYWDRETQKQQGHQESFKVDLTTAMQRFNQTGGVHTVQMMYGCELDDDGSIRGYMQYGYDGEDFISFDLKTLTYTAANQKALVSKHKWESSEANVSYMKNYLEGECIDWLKKYLSYGRETRLRTVPPEAKVFWQHISSPELVCHATGFFPRNITMSWEKDGEEVEEDVKVRETLPNQDGSFQKRIILRVSPEDLQKNKYTCVVQHSSLEEDLKMDAKNHRILRVGPDDKGLTGIIVGVVVGLLFLVLVGILVWRWRNFGFKPVSSGSGSEEEEQNQSERLVSQPLDQAMKMQLEQQEQNSTVPSD